MCAARAASDGRGGRKRQEKLDQLSEALIPFFRQPGKIFFVAGYPLMSITGRGLIVKEANACVMIRKGKAARDSIAERLSGELFGLTFGL